ncbi:MAG: tetratricopeptide repeat protein [Anaerolineaceae bacterium]|nr:tetratricopeptide repeat protein [Anaerolineaceae bacterium]
MTENREYFIKAMSQGHSAAWEQKWENAAAYYRQALQEIPQDPTALNSLGLALFEMHAYDEALTYYQQAARSVPEDPLPFEKMGAIFEAQKNTASAVKGYIEAAELYLKTRNVEKSIDNWVKALQLQPNHLLPRSRLAVIYERTGRQIEAVSEYLALASLLQHKNDIARAVETTEIALKLMPDNVEAQQTLAMLKKNQILPLPGKPKKTSGSLRPVESSPQLEAVKSDSQHFDPIEEGRRTALSRLAQILFDESDSPEVVDTERYGLASITRGTGRLRGKQGDKTRTLLHLGQAIDSETQGDHNQSAREIERAIELGLDHPAALYLFSLLTYEKNHQKAVQHLLVSVKHPRYALPSYLLLAKIYQSTGEYSQSLTYYLQALHLADAETIPAGQADELRRLYEPILENPEQLTREESELRKLCESIAVQLLRPDWRHFLQIARQQLTSTGKEGAPVPLAEMLLETDSGHVLEVMNRIKELAAAQKVHAAAAEAYDALETSPTYLPLHIQIAELLVQQGRIQEAVTKFMLAADLYTLRGEAAQAVRLLTRVTQIAPLDLTIQNKLIELLVSQGKTNEAIQQYLEIAGFYYQLAELDLARQAYASALRLAHKSSADPAWNLQILYKIADIDTQRLDWKQATRIFEQIRTLEPEDINARVQLVSLNFRLGQEHTAMTEVDNTIALMENSGKREKAIEFLQLVSQELPDNLDIQKRLADLYIRGGKTPQAVKTLETMTSALLKLGSLQKAAGVLETIISLKPPNTTDYQKILQKIQVALKDAGFS